MIRFLVAALTGYYGTRLLLAATGAALDSRQEVC